MNIFSQLLVKDSHPTSIPTIRGVGGGSQVTGGTGMNPTLPSGSLDDDILILVCSTSLDATISAPTGWTDLGQVATGNTAARISVFWKRYVAGGGAPTVTLNSSANGCCQILGVIGCVKNGSPWDATQINNQNGNNGSASEFVNGITTTVPNALVVVLATINGTTSGAGTAFSGWTNSDLSSLTERMDFQGGAMNVGGATGGKAVPGVVGNTTFTVAASRFGGQFCGALIPA